MLNFFEGAFGRARDCNSASRAAYANWRRSIGVKLTYQVESHTAPELVERQQLPARRANRFLRRQLVIEMRLRAYPVAAAWIPSRPPLPRATV